MSMHNDNIESYYVECLCVTAGYIKARKENFQNYYYNANYLLLPFQIYIHIYTVIQLLKLIFQKEVITKLKLYMHKAKNVCNNNALTMLY